MYNLYRILVRGVVQGVGFRPYVYRKAKQLGLVGYAKNVGEGVEILVNDMDFMTKLSDLPPLAKISGFEVGQVETPEPYADFFISESSSSEGVTSLPPDIFTCNECIGEVRDAKNRRHNYYFITCTNCGPRFTVIQDYPYDRPFTSMKHFAMCKKCEDEYGNPMDRRYHAQTNACQDCGPRLMLKDGNKDVSGSTDMETIRMASEILKAGNPVAIKGVGGFHVCSLTDDVSVGKVRQMLHRPNKPYAIMVSGIEMLDGIAYVNQKERQLLTSPERPIVVLRKKKTILNCISELDTIGVMLPYTALHYLLFDFIKEPLLATSCNLPGNPIAIHEELATYFLTHERQILNRCDDSVVKVINDKPFFLRRSRGFVPLPVPLPVECRDTIALGAEINNVICIAKKNQAFLSQYIGETSTLETFDYLKETAHKFIKLTRAMPLLVVCDAHPLYNSTALGGQLARTFNVELLRVQHHKAHVASVAAEHNLEDYVGIAVDGMGYGDDGNIWGGEVFDVNRHRFRRIGYLEPQPQLGGDSATIFPRKMLFGILRKFLDANELERLAIFDKKQSRLYSAMVDKGFSTPVTTSAGRVLDAVSALLNLCERRTYDGRPAMLLESLATEPLDFEPVFSRIAGAKILMTSPLFEFLLSNMEQERGHLAATAQTYLARGLLTIAQEAARGRPIVISGGVAYNRMIAGFMLRNDVLVNEVVPCGDGGISYGQAYLANLEHHNL
jgi:hydrogenase maturation protein HypF